MIDNGNSRTRIRKSPKRDSKQDFIQRKKILARQIAEFKAQPQSFVINRIIAELEKEYKKMIVLIDLF